METFGSGQRPPARADGAQTLLVGIVVGRFGLRGELKVRVETDFPERFTAGQTLQLQLSGETRSVHIDGARFHKRQVLLKLQGIDTPEAADALRGGELHIALADRQPLPPNTYYFYELVGLNVYRSDDESYLGQIVEIWQPGGADVYLVKHPDEPGRWMIPAVSRFVQRIDVPSGRMWVTVEDGLRE